MAKPGLRKFRKDYGDGEGGRNRWESPRERGRRKRSSDRDAYWDSITMGDSSPTVAGSDGGEAAIALPPRHRQQVERDRRENPPREAPRPEPQPQFTRDIRGTQVDFSRLTGIQALDTMYNGNMTYGIRFDFLGSKGYHRTVWYGRNPFVRDRDLQEYTRLREEAEAATKASRSSNNNTNNNINSNGNGKKGGRH